MERIGGKVAFGGIAIGVIREVFGQREAVQRRTIANPDAETARFEKARETADAELQRLYEKALKEAGAEEADIFEVHRMMLEDEDYVGMVRELVETESVNAEYAVESAGNYFAELFVAMEDEYMKERAADVKDISMRLIRILSQKPESANTKETEKNGEREAENSETQGTDGVESRAGKNTGERARYIIVTDDLTPSETLQMDRESVLAFATRKGSVNSHTAILARSMNIPALVSVPLGENVDGRQAVVDGNSGVFVLEPTEEVLQQYRRIQQTETEQKEMLQQLIGQPCKTPGGREIMLYANIGGPKDVDAVLTNDAAGIGLFRSEFLYLQSSDYPTEEMQFEIYKNVAERMGGKKVIIRTLDIGADKKVDYFGLCKEENPALGYRAVRICLTRPEIFRTQLRAIYRASAYGNVAVMIPMIAAVWEVRKVKEIIAQIQKELAEEGIRFGKVEFGIMVETPAAVLIADDLAKEVDFFSIGTNDLTQYTLAVDRQNSQLEQFYDAHHPAVLKMIQMVIDSAHREGIWAGICGELGADLELTETFLQMGIDELSVAPAMVLPVKNRIVHSNL